MITARLAAASDRSGKSLQRIKSRQHAGNNDAPRGAEEATAE
jgi:hypothetical protein